jgi:hypothetical protein
VEEVLHAAGRADLGPGALEILRTSGAVRLRLSVRASQRIATPRHRSLRRTQFVN